MRNEGNLQVKNDKCVLKICLLGEDNIGKRSLITQIVEEKFSEKDKSTLGVNLLKYDTTLKGYGDIFAQIWVLGGQKSFQSLRKLYLEGANGAIAIFDVTKRKSFIRLTEWIQSFKEARGEQPLLLVGNKIDLDSQIQVNEDEARDFAKENNMDLIFTSVKTTDKFKDVFNSFLKVVVEKLLN